MYTQTISNKELIQHHGLVKYNASLTIAEIIDNPLFIVEEQNDGGLYKIIPLFTCDEIISTNPQDISFGGKCVICINNEGTILNFISKSAIDGFIINADIVEKYGDTLLIGVVLDDINKVRLSGIEINIEILDRNMNLKKRYMLKTDAFGGFIQRINEYMSGNKIRIKASYENIVKEQVM